VEEFNSNFEAEVSEERDLVAMGLEALNFELG